VRGPGSSDRRPRRATWRNGATARGSLLQLRLRHRPTRDCNLCGNVSQVECRGSGAFVRPNRTNSPRFGKNLSHATVGYAAGSICRDEGDYAVERHMRVTKASCSTSRRPPHRPSRRRIRAAIVLSLPHILAAFEAISRTTGPVGAALISYPGGNRSWFFGLRTGLAAVFLGILFDAVMEARGAGDQIVRLHAEFCRATRCVVFGNASPEWCT